MTRRGFVYLNIRNYEDEKFKKCLKILETKINIIEQDMIGEFAELYCTSIHFQEIDEEDDIPTYAVMFVTFPILAVYFEQKDYKNIVLTMKDMPGLKKPKESQITIEEFQNIENDKISISSEKK